jgi:hypothetical protein
MLNGYGCTVVQAFHLQPELTNREGNSLNSVFFLFDYFLMSCLDCFLLPNFSIGIS